MVICLGDMSRMERALFVLAFLVAMRLEGTDRDSADLLVLDEMKAVFGGQECHRRPESLEEDTSASLLGDLLEQLMRGARQRRTTAVYCDQLLADVPPAVRDRAAVHIKFHHANRADLDLFGSLCGLGQEQYALLREEMNATRTQSSGAPGRLCLVGGPHINNAYGQPYITTKTIMEVKR